MSERDPGSAPDPLSAEPARGSTPHVNGATALVGIMVSWTIAGLGPVRRVAGVHQGYGIRAITVAVIVLAAVLALGPGAARRRVVWVTAALGATVALGAAAGGRLVGLWLLPSTALGAWVGRPLPFLGLPPLPRRGRLPVLALSLVSAYSAGHDATPRRALVFLAAAGLVAATLARWPGLVDVMDRCGAAVSRVVIRTLRVLLLTPVYLVVALLPWLAHRLTAFDPVRPRGETWGWVERRDEPDVTGDLWFADPARHPPPWRRRVHARLPLLLTVGAAAAVWYGAVVVPSTDPPVRNAVERRVRNTPWADEIYRATADASNDIWFSQYAGNEWSDTTTRYLNIRDGRRRTWAPTTCTAEPTVVWMFGGSTLFGILHRDLHTLPSHLARVAAAEGRHLEIVNWGMVSDVVWQQNRRLERALASGAAPDLVVYYDGWNDFRTVVDMDFTGRGGDTDFVGPMDRLQTRVLTDLGGISPGAEYTVRVPDIGASQPKESRVALAQRSYTEADRLARLLTADRGATFVHFHQPNLLTRSTPAAGEPSADRRMTQLMAAFRRTLPPDVVDLGAALDRSGALYYDDVHTSEAGNPIIAAAMLDALGPTLDTLGSVRGEPCR